MAAGTTTEEKSRQNLSLPDRQQTWELDETLMYGQYSRDLSMQVKQLLRQSKKEDIPKGLYAHHTSRTKTIQQCCRSFHNIVISKVGEDWIFLTILGVIMALLSYAMDFIIHKCEYARKWLYDSSEGMPVLQFVLWILFPIVLICFSSGFVHLVGPNAIGSGIPEMKTILRGVVLKEYLTLRTLIAKIIGLCTSLGCGLPIGKEGPFVHVASITATLLSKFITSVTGIYENESRTNEMLAAACAVGVACTFAAPIGGVLFSIEVTASYFAVRNYWRGFYSAVCGALVFRILAIIFSREETITALFKTNLRQEFPFDVVELIAFGVIGIACGFAGALFVYTHRKFVTFIRSQKKLKAFLQKNRFIFPASVMFLIATVNYPGGLGQFNAGRLTNGEALDELFTNVTWSDPTVYLNVNEKEILQRWAGPTNNIFLTLICFIVMRFLGAAMATALPVPSGVFMPIFTIGAAFGRLMGECMAVWFPQGIGGQTIVPGGYAIVGAAALSGSVTHTISTAVIVFELTGQIAHVLPCVISVMIANGVAASLQPSFYDMIIQIKRLPYLPETLLNTKLFINAHRIFVEDIMVKDVVVVTSYNTLEEITQVLQTHDFKTFPLVDTDETRILLGSIERLELQRLLDNTLTRENKLTYFRNKQKERLEQRMAVLPASPASKRQDPPTDGSLQVPVLERLQQPITSSPGRFAVYMVDEANAQEEEAEIWKKEHLKDHSGEGNPSKPRSILKKSPSGIDLEHRAKVHFTAETPIKEGDITPEMESAWIQYQLKQPVQFEKCNIDPAPFQLVERTSLYKVHSLFSLLSLHHAYVTNMGRLVGIISLKEVRAAIQGEVSAVRVFSTKKITQENIETEQRKIDRESAGDTTSEAARHDTNNTSYA